MGEEDLAVSGWAVMTAYAERYMSSAAVFITSPAFFQVDGSKVVIAGSLRWLSWKA